VSEQQAHPATTTARHNYRPALDGIVTSLRNLVLGVLLWWFLGHLVHHVIVAVYDIPTLRTPSFSMALVYGFLPLLALIAICDAIARPSWPKAGLAAVAVASVAIYIASTHQLPSIYGGFPISAGVRLGCRPGDFTPQTLARLGVSSSAASSVTEVPGLDIVWLDATAPGDIAILGRNGLPLADGSKLIINQPLSLAIDPQTAQGLHRGALAAGGLPLVFLIVAGLVLGVAGRARTP